MQEAGKALYALFFVLAVPVVIALFLAIRFIYRKTVGERRKTTITEDYRIEAERHEKAGRYVSAANIYETRLKETARAAALYEKGGDYGQAASLYDFLGETAKAKELYEKTGQVDDAAEVMLRDGEFEEAARIYSKAGKKLDEALVMEKAGRRLAAVRAYREAGDYKNASRLLDLEGMLTEAAEMYGFGLGGKPVDASTIDDYYVYAFKLERAGHAEEALEIYQAIDAANPTYKDVREKIQALAPEEGAAEVAEGTTSVRNFINSSYLEPKYSLKLWLQVLKRLQEEHHAGRPFGLMSPENILIDAHNTISFLKRPVAAAYLPPEQTKGLELDERADVYSMGIILYEMLSGNLEGLGTRRVADVSSDVPEWLDDLVIKCIRKVREDRCQSIDEIFETIKTLSRERREQERKE